MIINNLDIRIVATQTGELLRHLTLDPTRDYQPQNADPKKLVLAREGSHVSYVSRHHKCARGGT